MTVGFFATCAFTLTGALVFNFAGCCAEDFFAGDEDGDEDVVFGMFVLKKIVICYIIQINKYYDKYSGLNVMAELCKHNHLHKRYKVCNSDCLHVQYYFFQGVR